MVIYKKTCAHCRKLKPVCSCGRPLFDGKDEKLVLSKLDEAFAYGLNDKEACLYAGISTSAYYRFIEKRPEIRERKERLKVELVLALRKVTIEHAKNNPQMALKLLERLQPSEFGPTITRPLPAPETPATRPFSDRAATLLMKYNSHPETWKLPLA